MPFNGAGSYSPPGADFPAVPNTLIESAKFNSIINDIATALSTCITKDGQTTVTANIPMGGYRFTGLGAGAANGQSLRYEQLFTTGAVTLLGAMNWVKGADIASAATVDLSAATGNGVHVTGTTAITAVTLASGAWRQVIFDGILTLTHHTTNNNLPGGANITTAAGDRALYWSDGTTVYCVTYVRSNGESLITAPFADTTAIVKGSADPTKLLRFEVGGFTTATTRVMTPPNFDGTIATLAGTETFTNKTLTSPVINTAVTGTAIATQAQQEAGTAVNVLVTPGRQQYHPSACKAWASADFAGAFAASYGMSSVTDTGVGQQTFNYSTAFSSANYGVLCMAESTLGGTSGTTPYSVPDAGGSKSANSVLVRTIVFSTFSVTDGSRTSIACFGDQ